ncbi:MAG: acetyl-CoA carboxylase, carboxyltransferase subunit beta [Planctomycetota bacterium]
MSGSTTRPVPKTWRDWQDTQTDRRRGVPEGLWLRCPGCSQMIYRRQMEANQHVCPECDHHFRIDASERIKQLTDPDSFVPAVDRLLSIDPLKFRDLKAYPTRLEAERVKSGRPDAILAGTGYVKGRESVLCVLDLSFMMGSMGSVVGEGVTRSVELAMERKLPLVIVSASGGARMQESGLSLMQMAKTSAVLAKFDREGGLFISVLTDPTTGGVTASFAMLGDIMLAEPKALIGFAGPRVIKQTIRQDLPEGFQRSEFLVGAGLIDRVVHRRDLRTEIARLIDYAGG